MYLFSVPYPFPFLSFSQKQKKKNLGDVKNQIITVFSENNSIEKNKTSKTKIIPELWINVVFEQRSRKI